MRFRSVLFVPGHRLDLLAKAPRWRPDAVVVDLEDAVAAADKDAARGAVQETELHVPGSTVLVRVNPPGTPWHEADVAAAVAAGAAGVMLPKADDPEAVTRLGDRLATAVGAEPCLVVGVETALGVARAREVLGTGVVTAAYFGAEDYIADLGGRRTPAGLEVLHARSEVVLAGRLAGTPVIDQAVVALDDDDAFVADAEAGRALGYTGKLCVHPRQVALAHAVFTPSEAEVAAARRVVEAATTFGVAVVDGQMVDAVHLRLARQVLERAGAAGIPS
jgi:citrate lyase subunit beta/citryl-CoA lyase